MARLYLLRNPSMLIPHQAETDWTDTERVLSDNNPAPAGIGASVIAQQALGISPAAAANLVSSAGATNMRVPELAGAAPLTTPLPAPRGVVATRLPIPSSVNPAKALIGGDPNRAFIIIQNNNAAGGANLLISVDGAIDTTQSWAYLNLAAGSQGILLDEEVFVNSIYVAWASGTVTGGMIFFGSRPPPVPNT